MTVLGVSLGTRTTGIAILRHRQVLVSDTLTSRHAKKDKRSETVGRYIRQYKVLNIVLKTPPATHLSEQLKTILRQFIKLFEYHGCMVEYKGSADIKRSVPSIRNMADLIAFATDAYPVLTDVHLRELSNRNKYHHKMFEAVVIAHLRHQELTNENSP